MSLLGIGAPGLRVPRHRTTTAHLGALYPFQAEAGLGPRGILLGTDEVSGDAGFCFDPFELYTAKVLTNPNMVVVGEPGSGKSAALKCFVHRCLGALRSPGGLPRWGAIVDPKGEYTPLAEVLGLEVVRLYPGGPSRLNPLDAGPAGAWATGGELAARRTAMVVALVGAVLRRELYQIEDAALGWALDALERASGPTLADVAHLLAAPSAEMAERAATTPAELARRIEEVRFALGKLLDRSLRGMFDGTSTHAVDWSGRGIVLDLSVVRDDPDALRVVMVAATAWLQAALASPETAQTPRRIQVLDEAWALLADERTARYLQSCWKLCRSYGVANVAIAHRISDLSAQADDGTATAKIAHGLLADTQTRVLFAQAPDQLELATKMFGLSEPEAATVARLRQGHALWKVGGISAVVHHALADDQRPFCLTDARLEV